MALSQTDIFNETVITIPDNTTLARVATHLLHLIERDKTLIAGDDRGMIDKKCVLAYWISDGLTGENFKEFFLSKKHDAGDTVTRALRFLVEKDYVRLSAAAVKDGVNQASRLAKAFHK